MFAKCPACLKYRKFVKGTVVLTKAYINIFFSFVDDFVEISLDPNEAPVEDELFPLETFTPSIAVSEVSSGTPSPTPPAQEKQADVDDVIVEDEAEVEDKPSPTDVVLEEVEMEEQKEEEEKRNDGEAEEEEEEER